MFDDQRLSKYSQIKKAIIKIFTCTLYKYFLKGRGKVIAEMGECEK